MRDSLKSGSLAWLLATVLMAPVGQLQAAPAFPALTRPALQVKAPERQVMQAAAQAGRRIVAVGERGLVVLSDDVGVTWRQARQVPVSTTLTALSFVDDKSGWAVGHGGVVLHTRDGGETWVKQVDGVALAQAAVQAAERALSQAPDSATAARGLEDARMLVADGADKPLLDVQFQDAQRGWVVGAYNLFFETTDGGATWNSVSARLTNPKALHLNAIRAVGQTVFIVGEQGQMHRSLDGGRSFESVQSPYKGSWFALALQADGSVTVAGLRGNAFRSPDGGHTWAPVQGLPPVSIVSASVLPDGGVLLANQGGQMFVTRAGAAPSLLRAPAMPSLNGLLLLSNHSLLALGFGGVMPLPASSQSEKLQ